jgi:hypothetical protein
MLKDTRREKEKKEIERIRGKRQGENMRKEK